MKIMLNKSHFLITYIYGITITEYIQYKARNQSMLGNNYSDRTGVN
jgi:hypothetical protein